MNYLICGAGTIGTTYAYLLSRAHNVELLVKPEQAERLAGGVPMALKDLAKHAGTYERRTFRPRCVTEIEKPYDGVLVAVNRCQLQSLLPRLAQKRACAGYFAFMQNNWDLRSEVEACLGDAPYAVAFPSNVGGGRDETGIQAILFDEPARLGGPSRSAVEQLRQGFEAAGIRTCEDPAIFDWLKVHYLQQSITAGALLERGSFAAFAKDYRAVKKMVAAFREGIAVCARQGVDTRHVFPANLFRLPTFLVAHTMQRMFLTQDTREMVENHSKKGLPEWAAGYREVLAAGRALGLPMTAWASYEDAVEAYLRGGPA